MNEGELSGRLGLPGWPGIAEEVIVARDVMLARHTGSRVHVAHASTAGTVEVCETSRSIVIISGPCALAGREAISMIDAPIERPNETTSVWLTLE